VGVIAAIFDVDRTLVRPPTERLFFLYLIWRRKISLIQALCFLMKLPRQADYRFQDKTYLKGLAVPEIELLAGECYQKYIKPRLSRAGLACLQAHKEKDHKIIILTGSLQCLMLPLQRDLEADWLIAAALETREGRCTGAVAGLHPRGNHKLLLLQELAQREGIDLASSYAYADHISDLPVLLSVGHAVAVNPSRRLRMSVRERGWPMRRF